MFRVKICGITDPDDLRMVEEAGADAAGFVFFRRSKRYVDFEHCREIIRKASPKLLTVGVFVNTPADIINRVASIAGISAVQLSGFETDETVKAVELPTIKVFRPETPDDVKKAEQCPADAIMFDAAFPGSFGGTGKQLDYTLILEAGIKREFLIAGGLNPENVRDVVTLLKPAGVDVSTGVELFPGKKDPRKVRDFVRAASEALGA
ncbi:MAG: phosphoribosylanthranilate isomerase [Deltaproteobacteria bacterium]|nr:MAG: phosphoribosylanthranilate isomerase [Deltaproteobacteria bacterium]